MIVQITNYSMRILLTASIAFSMIAPFTIQAQESDLVTTIRAEIMKDPRSTDIPPAQMDSMVAALAEAAAAQGVTATDITWRPAEVDTSAQPTTADCGFFCRVNGIFGFEGDDYTIPLGLGVSSAILILIISMMFHRHHAHGVMPTIDAVHEHPGPASKHSWLHSDKI